jgi:hypothetical protein
MRFSKSSKKKINNRTSKKKRSIRYYTGGREIPPKWKQYGHRTEAAYLEYIEEQRRQIEREREIERRRERQINIVLIDVIIDCIRTLIMNPDQSERFEAYIRENIRIVNTREELNQMVDNFVNFAVTNLLYYDQRVLTNRILNEIQQERIAKSSANQPFGRLDILNIFDRVFRENIDRDAVRSGGRGKKKYNKRVTHNDKSNHR